ncbi:alcohol dehydrogenase catalytic domain-containing protein [Streptomyces phaeolivaceus]|uniref:Alcohol dehydrogenase catalytic domain-containing protein n=1 Tax=Streptomyces phaeolivaceus TaxID=2653200 RepID=A0A5P8KF79_9ACTN|nr:alcohol dehydrogenase catalytic domain-containing protein [Streptomyces phaeolivaceus]QFR01671.1 alcohol dehydrogenase catalytic domain-containing protein [Streptomyces phaeolivaceus]
MSARPILGAVLDRIPADRPYDRTRPLSVGELTLAPPGPTEVLVRMEAAGVCHSDLSVVDGNRVRPVPMLLGHEAAGRVLEVGSQVGDLRAGQRLVMTFLPRCDECRGCATEGRTPCERGSASNAEGHLLAGGSRLYRGSEPVRHHLGVSAFATHAVVDRRSVVPVADDVPADLASLLGCAVLTGGGAVLNAGRPGPGDDVAVVGLGGVGMAALLTALALGHGRVVGVDVSKEKLRTASELGADAVLTPEQALEQGLRAAVVVEAAGSAPAFETAFALTAPGGRTVATGLPGARARASISPLLVTAEARTVIGSYLGSAVPHRDIPRYVGLWREGRLPLERLISHRLRLPEINSAMERLAEGSVLRQVVMFDDES